MNITQSIIDREVKRISDAASRTRKTEGQYSLGMLIEALQKCGPSATVRFDFVYLRPDGVHSYRGYYDQLQVGYTNDGEITVEAFLAELVHADGAVFQGYKGGHYCMTRDTPMWVGNYGEAGSTAIVGVVDEDYQVVLLTQKMD